MKMINVKIVERNGPPGQHSFMFILSGRYPIRHRKINEFLMVCRIGYLNFAPNATSRRLRNIRQVTRQ